MPASALPEDGTLRIDQVGLPAAVALAKDAFVDHVDSQVFLSGGIAACQQFDAHDRIHDSSMGPLRGLACVGVGSPASVDHILTQRPRSRAGRRSATRRRI